MDNIHNRYLEICILEYLYFYGSRYETQLILNSHHPLLFSQPWQDLHRMPAWRHIPASSSSSSPSSLALHSGKQSSTATSGDKSPLDYSYSWTWHTGSCPHSRTWRSKPGLSTPHSREDKPVAAWALDIGRNSATRDPQLSGSCRADS